VQPQFGVVVDAGDPVLQRPIPHRARARTAPGARLLAVVRVHRTRSYDSQTRRLRWPLAARSPTPGSAFEPMAVLLELVLDFGYREYQYADSI
jgi:hypothetical protein